MCSDITELHVVYPTGTTIDMYSCIKRRITMSFKNVSTVLLIIVATALLTILAFKVRPCAMADQAGKDGTASRGCCGGCASSKQNQAKGELK